MDVDGQVTMGGSSKYLPDTVHLRDSATTRGNQVGGVDWGRRTPGDINDNIRLSKDISRVSRQLHRSISCKEVASNTMCKELFANNTENCMNMNTIKQGDKELSIHCHYLNANISSHTSKTGKISLGQRGVINTGSGLIIPDINESQSQPNLLETNITSVRLHSRRCSLQHTDPIDDQTTNGLTTNTEINANDKNNTEQTARKSSSSYCKLQNQHSPGAEYNEFRGNSNNIRNSWILTRNQEQNRLTIPGDSHKTSCLIDNQQSSSSSASWKISDSGPMNLGPQVSLRNPDSCGSGDTTSQYHIPIGSRRPWKPRHKPRTQEKEHKKGNTGPGVTDGARINYYPKCDPTIWIRSCTQEVLQPLSGVQSGVIPSWLRGTLIRNGPGRLQVGQDQYNHVFDGSALLHRFHFSDGKVTYQNKFLESRSYLKDTQAQRIVVNYFGTRAHPDPCKTIFQNISSKFTLEEHFTDNAQISLYPYGDGLYALTETPFIYRVDPDTLNTHEKVNLTQHLAVFNHTAHPHVDRDGTVYNIGQGVGPFGPRYYICKFPNTKTNAKGKVKTPFEQAVVVGSVGARWMFNPCYMHSFAMTENYWVILEQPLVVSLPKILKALVKQDALFGAFQWYEKETKIHVVRRDTGRVTKTQYVTKTFFFLHTINAYEDNGHIILDIAAYKNPDMLQCMYVEALKNAAFNPTYAQMFRGRPKRWVLPLRPGKDTSPHANLITLPNTSCRARWLKKNVVHVTSELLADIGCEVPRIYYEKYNGQHYQYFYAICSDVDHPCPGTLVKVDVVNKRHVEWSEDNVYPSEPIFVPLPHAQREDEGVVLCALLRAEGRDCEVCLLILDATSFTELGRVEFNAPGPVPKCLHGWFVPEGSLKVCRKEEKQQEYEVDQ